MSSELKEVTDPKNNHILEQFDISLTESPSKIKKYTSSPKKQAMTDRINNNNKKTASLSNLELISHYMSKSNEHKKSSQIDKSSQSKQAVKDILHEPPKIPTGLKKHTNRTLSKVFNKTKTTNENMLSGIGQHRVIKRNHSSIGNLGLVEKLNNKIIATSLLTLLEEAEQTEAKHEPLQYDWSTFQKPYEKRTDSENQYCITELKNSEFLKVSYNDLIAGSKKVNITKNYHDFAKEWNRLFESKKYRKHDCILHNGEIGLKSMYYILQGEASVYVRKTCKEIEDEFYKLTKIIDKLKSEDNYKEVTKDQSLLVAKRNFRTKVYYYLSKKIEFDEYLPIILTRINEFPHISREDFNMQTIGKQSNYYANGIFLYKKVNTLKEDGVFGKLSELKGPNKNSTVVAKTELSVLEISQEDFNTIISSTIKSESEKNEFFKAIFRLYVGSKTNLDRTSVIEFQNCFKEETYNRGKFIFQQGDPIDKIYLIKEGDVLLYKNCHDVNNLDNSQLRKEINNINILKIIDEQQKKLAEVQHTKKKDLIGIISNQDFLGEEILWNKDITHRAYTASAVTQPTIIYEADQNTIRRKTYIIQTLLQDLEKLGSVKNDYNTLRANKNHEISKHINEINSVNHKSMIAEKFQPQYKIEYKAHLNDSYKPLLNDSYKAHKSPEINQKSWACACRCNSKIQHDELNNHSVFRDKMIVNDKAYLQKEKEKNDEHPYFSKKYVSIGHDYPPVMQDPINFVDDETVTTHQKRHNQCRNASGVFQSVDVMTKKLILQKYNTFYKDNLKNKQQNKTQNSQTNNDTSTKKDDVSIITGKNFFSKILSEQKSLRRNNNTVRMLKTNFPSTLLTEPLKKTFDVSQRAEISSRDYKKYNTNSVEIINEDLKIKTVNETNIPKDKIRKANGFSSLMDNKLFPDLKDQDKLKNNSFKINHKRNLTTNDEQKRFSASKLQPNNLNDASPTILMRTSEDVLKTTKVKQYKSDRGFYIKDNISTGKKNQISYMDGQESHKNNEELHIKTLTQDNFADNTKRSSKEFYVKKNTFPETDCPTSKRKFDKPIFNQITSLLSSDSRTELMKKLSSIKDTTIKNDLSATTTFRKERPNFFQSRSSVNNYMPRRTTKFNENLINIVGTKIKTKEVNFNTGFGNWSKPK